MSKLSLLLLTVVAFINARAQKLPNVQQASMRAPTNVKIDTKTEEWGGFKAFNPATEVFYSLANDDKKLYLIIHTDQSVIANRAVIGGIRLLVQTNGSKSIQGAKGIKFPFFEKGFRVIFPVKKIGEVNTPAQGDSIMKAYNQRLASNVKWIYTKGISGIDSVISVYNDNGIEAAGAYDQNRGYTCEMAIDLALLGIKPDAVNKFSYNITINAEPNKFSMPGSFTLVSGTNADGSKMNEAQFAAFSTNFDKQNNITYATTDFWGEYTLAK